MMAGLGSCGNGLRAQGIFQRRARLTRPSHNIPSLSRPRLQSQQHGFATFQRPTQQYVPIHFGPPQSSSRSWKIWLPRLSAGIAIFTIGGLYSYSLMHQAENPSGRKRLILYNEKDMLKEEQQNPLYAHIKQIIQVGKAVPGLMLKEDDPSFLAARKVLDRMLRAYDLDPAQYKLHIENPPDTQGGFVVVFEDKTVFMVTSLLNTVKCEEELAAYFSNELARTTGGNRNELLSYMWFRTAAAIPAIQLTLTSFFMGSLWFVTIPYLAWYAKYWELDALSHVKKDDVEGEQEEVIDIEALGAERGERLDVEDAQRTMIHLAKAGIHPRWAVSAWHTHALKTLQSLAARPEGTEPPALIEVIGYVQKLTEAQDYEVRAIRTLILLTMVEREMPNFPAWGTEKPTPLPPPPKSPIVDGGGSEFEQTGHMTLEQLVAPGSEK